MTGNPRTDWHGDRDARRRGSAAIVAVAAALAIAILVVDIASPRGVADGVGYVAFVLLSMWMPWQRSSIVTASIATMLIGIGYVLSTPDVQEWIVWTNRALTVAVAWTIAILLRVHRITEKRLHDDRIQLCAITATSPDAVLITDGDGLIERINPACQRMFGYSQVALRGCSIDKLLADPQKPLSPVLQAWPKSPTRIIEWYGRHRNGVAFPVQISIRAAVLLKSRIFTIFIHDVTDARVSEHKVQELQVQLSRMARRSELGGMASAIAHELNQPISALRTHIASAQRFRSQPSEAATTDIDDAMEKAMRQVDTAAAVIRHILYLLRDHNVERRVEDLHETIREASTFALVGTRMMGLNVRMDLPADTCPCLINRVQIQQVMINLVRNSVDALASCRRRELVIRASQAGTHEIEVEVSDSGGGLDQEVRRKLFMPFVTTKPNGVGIGLSDAHSIVEAHGGSIHASANAMDGTTFRFRLPIASAVP